MSHWKYPKKKKEIISSSSEEIQSIPFNSSQESYYDKFLIDWQNARVRHPAQQLIIDEFFQNDFLQTFIRAGRKFAKTSTMIDIAWKLANRKPNQVGYYCFPTISQAIDVVWEENRLQNMDLKTTEMQEKYVEKIDNNKHMITFRNGSFIKLVGTWTESKSRGTQPDFLLIDELQDCKPDYLDAMDPNLGAKNAPVLMSGTPPRKRNHYNDWWERVGRNSRGKTYKFTSYDNKSLDHLKDWLDNKKLELINAGKEDEWIREYLAEDCFSSSERVLPDLKFIDHANILANASNLAQVERIPILGVSVHPRYFCAILAVLNAKSGFYVLDRVLFPEIWNRSFAQMFPLLGEKIKTLQDFCGKKLRKIVWDESNSFNDVIDGFTKCRKDPKWQTRGIPILREMILSNKIQFSSQVGDIGLEFQNLLMDESQTDIEKNYPHICTLAMLSNEYFQRDKIKIVDDTGFDKYAALREMGLLCPPLKKRLGKTIFTIGI